MKNNSAESVVAKKTRELCQAILDEPAFETCRGKMEAFFSNEAVRSQYDQLREKGSEMHQKQHEGVEPTADEIREFEQLKKTFMANPVGRGFLDAQKEMGEIHESVNQHLIKTFELGRIPTAADLAEEACEPGCGCH